MRSATFLLCVAFFSIAIALWPGCSWATMGGGAASAGKEVRWLKRLAVLTLLLGCSGGGSDAELADGGGPRFMRAPGTVGAGEIGPDAGPAATGDRDAGGGSSSGPDVAPAIAVDTRPAPAADAPPAVTLMPDAAPVAPDARTYPLCRQLGFMRALGGSCPSGYRSPEGYACWLCTDTHSAPPSTTCLLERSESRVTPGCPDVICVRSCNECPVRAPSCSAAGQDGGAL